MTWSNMPRVNNGRYECVCAWYCFTGLGALENDRGHDKGLIIRWNLKEAQSSLLLRHLSFYLFILASNFGGTSRHFVHQQSKSRIWVLQRISSVYFRLNELGMKLFFSINWNITLCLLLDLHRLIVVYEKHTTTCLVSLLEVEGFFFELHKINETM